MTEQSNYKHYTRGGQISFHNLRMWDQITKTLAMLCLLAWGLFSVVLTWYFTSYDALVQTAYYQCATLLKLVRKEHVFHVPYQGHLFNQSVHAITTHPYYAKISTHVFNVFIQSLWMGLGLSLLLGMGLAIYFVRKGRLQTANHLIRGSQLEKSPFVKHQIIKNKVHSDISIDGFPLIKNSEVQHLLVHGTVGTGKSQLIMKILDSLRKRGDRVIVYDKGCAFIPHYFCEASDKILNPFDERCPNWDMWAEAPRDSDFENMAESLIPMHGESDPFWVNAARTVFSSVASTMRHDKERSLEKLMSLLLTGEFSQLEDYLHGTPAATLVSVKIEKTAISIRSVITTYLKSFMPLTDLSKGQAPFSIRDYILDENQKGWLFISSNGEQHKALKPLMSMWLAQASLTLLSLVPNQSRRIWFICDELPSLHKLPLLGETIAEVRKFGGCFLLGMQSFSQLEKVYGRSGAQEIFDLLNTRFFFRSASSDMARLVSRELGEEDIDESRENYSYGANSVRDGISLGTQRVVRPIISYPEVLEVPNLTCFVRLPGSYPVTKLQLKHQSRPVIAEGSCLRTIPNKICQTNLINEEIKRESEMPKSRQEVSISEYVD